MDPDMNKYDLNHRVSHHPKMSDAEWEDAYRAAWEAFYAPEHVRTILRRAAACRLGRPKTTLTTLLWFKLVSAYEGVHPLEGGAFRRKFRRDRRDGLPRENPVLFYPRYGPVQRAIRRAFAASGSEALTSSEIYDWAHVRRRLGRCKTMPFGVYSRTLRTLRAMWELLGAPSIGEKLEMRRTQQT